MTIEEWKSNASAEALAQYDKPVDWFKFHVKCCYNCSHWNNDSSLMGDYKYNFCMKHYADKKSLIAWDCFCDDYSGVAKEDNLLDYTKMNWDVDYTPWVKS